MRPLIVLGLETSCDETAAAIVRGAAPGPGQILSNVIFGQLDEHKAFGGVVPEIAARAHVEMLDKVIEEAFRQAGLSLTSLDAIAATAGPGLIGGVMVGLTTGKALALAGGKPFIGINHLEAHALTARLTNGATFPFLLLLISGGHCQLLGVEGVGQFRLYGTTMDDAIGEAFDKTAKMLGLSYPGGPEIEKLAQAGNPKKVALPRPMLGRPGADFSFSGLKTAVRQAIRDADKADLAVSFQFAVIDILIDRIRTAMEMFRRDFPDSQKTLVVAGGVAANSAIREAIGELCEKEGFSQKVPPPKLCTDNAAMVAWAGVERSQLGFFDTLGVAPKARWPLQSMAGGGSLARAMPEKPIAGP